MTDRFLLSHPRFHEKNLKFIIETFISNNYPLQFIFDAIHMWLKSLFNKQTKKQITDNINEIKKEKKTQIHAINMHFNCAATCFKAHSRRVTAFDRDYRSTVPFREAFERQRKYTMSNGRGNPREGGGSEEHAASSPASSPLAAHTFPAI